MFCLDPLDYLCNYYNYLEGGILLNHYYTLSLDNSRCGRAACGSRLDCWCVSWSGASSVSISWSCGSWWTCCRYSGCCRSCALPLGIRWPCGSWWTFGIHSGCCCHFTCWTGGGTAIWACCGGCCCSFTLLSAGIECKSIYTCRFFTFSGCIVKCKLTGAIQVLQALAVLGCQLILVLWSLNPVASLSLPSICWASLAC